VDSHTLLGSANSCKQPSRISAVDSHTLELQATIKKLRDGFAHLRVASNDHETPRWSRTLKSCKQRSRSSAVDLHTVRASAKSCKQRSRISAHDHARDLPSTVSLSRSSGSTSGGSVGACMAVMRLRARTRRHVLRGYLRCVSKSMHSPSTPPSRTSSKNANCWTNGKHGCVCNSNKRVLLTRVNGHSERAHRRIDGRNKIQEEAEWSRAHEEARL
jgi:hypothetical protein